MPYFLIILLLLIFSGLIFMNQKMKRTNYMHIRKIEQLKKTVVELAEKHFALKEKVELAGRFQETNNSNFEKLNKDISGLFDLLMKMIETKEQQNENT